MGSFKRVVQTYKGTTSVTLEIFLQNIITLPIHSNHTTTTKENHLSLSTTNHKTTIPIPSTTAKMTTNPNEPGAPLYSQAVSQEAGEPVTAEEIEQAPKKVASLEKQHTTPSVAPSSIESKKSTESSSESKKDESTSSDSKKSDDSSKDTSSDEQKEKSPGLISSATSTVTGAVGSVASGVTNMVGNTTTSAANTVGGVVGAASRGLGDTITSVTGGLAKPVGETIANVGTGFEEAVRGKSEEKDDKETSKGEDNKKEEKK